MGSLIKTGKRELGFTLIELLIAIIVTSIISIPVVRVLIDSSNNLQRAANEAAYNQQALEFMQKIQNDIKDSKETYIFDENFPTTNEHLCSSATTATWLNNSESFTRAITTIVGQKLVYPNNYNNPSFRVPQDVWVGYDLKRVSDSVTGLKNAYEIWRNECSSGGAIPTKSSPVLTLGNVLCVNSIGGSDLFVGITTKIDIGKSNCMSSVDLTSDLVNKGLSGGSMFACTGAGTSSCPINSTTLGIYKFDVVIPISACSPPILATLNSKSTCPTTAGTPRLPNPLSGLGRVFVQ